MRSFFLVFALGISTAVVAAVKVEPAVTERLDDMGKYLRSLQKFEVKSDVDFEVVNQDDQKADFKAKVTYKVQRPDKLFADIESDAKHRQYFYDGKTFTVYSPEEKLYGTIPVKGNLAAMARTAAEYGVEMPLADLFAWGMDKSEEKKITAALFVKKVEEGGRAIDQFAVRQGTVDWQVWLLEGDKPLPHKFVYTVTDDPARPDLTTKLAWDLEPQFEQAFNKFSPQKGSAKIEMRKPKKETK
ncbi:MAG: DUF2092 domain-containing protein [Bacteriovoracaceae bacterium]